VVPSFITTSELQRGQGIDPSSWHSDYLPHAAAREPVQLALKPRHLQPFFLIQDIDTTIRVEVSEHLFFARSTFCRRHESQSSSPPRRKLGDVRDSRLLDVARLVSDRCFRNRSWRDWHC